VSATAHEFGWQYLGIADHSKSERQANGLDEKRVRRAVRMSVDRYCSVLATVRVGTEVVDSVTIVQQQVAPAAHA